MSGNKDKFTPQEIGTTMAALEQIRCEPKLAMRIIRKMFGHSQPRSRGAPKKNPGEDVDTRRAVLIDNLRSDHPDIENDAEAVAFAVLLGKLPSIILQSEEMRTWFTEELLKIFEDSLLEKEIKDLLPKALPTDRSDASFQTLLQSISRGRRKLRRQK